MPGLLRDGTTKLGDVARNNLNPTSGTPPPAGEPGQTPVSPEQQGDYDKFVENGMRLIHDERAAPVILKGLEGDNDPVAGLANTLIMIVTRLEDSMDNQNVQIDPAMMVQGSVELLDELSDLAEEQGIHQFSKEEKEEATRMAIDIYQAQRQGQGQGQQPEPLDTGGGLEPVPT